MGNRIDYAHVPRHAHALKALEARLVYPLPALRANQQMIFLGSIRAPGKFNRFGLVLSVGTGIDLAVA
jgi:hypothetical protein